MNVLQNRNRQLIAYHILKGKEKYNVNTLSKKMEVGYKTIYNHLLVFYKKGLIHLEKSKNKNGVCYNIIPLLSLNEEIKSFILEKEREIKFMEKELAFLKFQKNSFKRLFQEEKKND